MKLNRINPFTNLPFNVNLNVSKQQINIFEANDESIQKIFANLNSDEREYILSGVPMGLFEIQFEKYFVVYFSLPFRKERYEIYFAKSLKNFYVYKLIDDVFDSLEIFKWEFINGFVKLEENKVETIILFHINYEINNNVEFVNFCKKIQDENELKYSTIDVLDILHEYSVLLKSKNSKNISNEIWLKNYNESKS